MKKIIRQFEDIEANTGEEKMYYSHKPKRSKSDKCIGEKRTMMMLKCFAQKIGRGQNYKYSRISGKWNGKSVQHIVSMYKNIRVDNYIQEYKDGKIEKKHRMTHRINTKEKRRNKRE